MEGSTGPRAGGILMFGEQLSNKAFDSLLQELDRTLNVGMQALEDSLCNWQKSPTVFKPFRG
jgi:hypothetical protein